jgi:hypothetical protein
MVIWTHASQVGSATSHPQLSKFNHWTSWVGESTDQVARINPQWLSQIKWFWIEEGLAELCITSSVSSLVVGPSVVSVAFGSLLPKEAIRPGSSTKIPASEHQPHRLGGLCTHPIACSPEDWAMGAERGQWWLLVGLPSTGLLWPLENKAGPLAPKELWFELGDGSEGHGRSYIHPGIKVPTQPAGMHSCVHCCLAAVSF